MKATKSISVLCIFFFVLVCFIQHAEAARTGNLKQKIAKGLLPKWCLGTEEGGLGNPMYLKYLKKYGDSWRGMHHYCRCLDAQNLAKQRKLENNQQFYIVNLKKAKMEAEYVIPRVADDFVMKPFILNNYGTILVQLNEISNAIKAFKRAIRLKPDYSKPYHHLSTLYYRHGMKKNAIDVLKKGIEICKNKEGLKRKLVSYSGNN